MGGVGEMSDTSLFSDEPILGPSLNLDASALDSNLRAVRQVESTWRLPSLPDEVRLDLAADPSIGADALSTFLYGLDRDLHGENDEDVAPETAVPQAPPLRVVDTYGTFGPITQSTFGEVYGLVNSLRGRAPLEQLDANANQRWKMRAIENGYMEAPPDGVVDGSWSPELNRLRQQMVFDDYDTRARGDRPGAMPIGGENGLLKVLNDWTSPSGLMRAALDLDLFWDFGQIGKEWSSWGDKWRKVGESTGPLDFGKNLFDALTGPIDDVVVPALNMTLLFSGVGAGVNFARLGAVGLKGAEAAQAFRGVANLYRLPTRMIEAGGLVGAAGRVIRPGVGLVERAFPALDAVGDARRAYNELGNASLLANRLRKGTGLKKDVGDALAAWRALPAVIGTRRAVQTGMRFSVASQLQDLLPSYQGLSLGENTGVGAAADELMAGTPAKIATTALEWAFTPYNTFDPGTILNTGRSLGRTAAAALGSTGGRAAIGAVAGAGVGAFAGDDTRDVLEGAAVGAGLAAAAPRLGAAVSNVPIVKHPGRWLEKLSFKPMTQDQAVTNVFYKALTSRLAGEELDTFNEGVRKDGFIKTFASWAGTDEEGIGGAMSFVLLSAAIDRSAALAAGKPGSKGWMERYYLARNQLTAQLRSLDGASKEEVVWTILSKETHSRRGLRKRWENAMGMRSEGADFDDVTSLAWRDEDLAEVVAAHNDMSRKTMMGLMSGEVIDLRDPGIQEYIANALDTFGRWGEYTSVTSQLRGLVGAGLLEDARLLQAAGPFNKRLNILDSLEDYADPIDDSKVDWAQDLHDTLFVERGVSLADWRKQGGYYAPLARELNPMRARFTLARQETITKQAMLAEADRLEGVVALAGLWRTVSQLDKRLGGGVIDVTKLGKLSTAQMSEFIKAISPMSASGAPMELGTADLKALRKLNRYVRSLGLDVDEAFEATLRKYADDLDKDVEWAETYGQAAVVRVGSGENVQTLTGLDALKERAKQLRASAKYKAAEIDVERHIADLRAAGRTKEADQLEQFGIHMQMQRYKMVYGTDFLHPDEVLHSTRIFDDINHRHLNAVTLGNFFGRRRPVELQENIRRARAASVARELSRVRGAALDPDHPDVEQVVRDLYDHVFRVELDRTMSMTDDLAHQTFLSKIGTAVRNADSPRNLQDLGLGKNQSRVVGKLVQLGYSKEEAFAVWRAVKASRHADWEDLGLYAIEAKLRGRSQLVDALRYLSGTTEGGKLKKVATMGAAPGFGALYGAVRAQETSDDQDVGMDRILTGAALGAAAGAGLGAVGRKVAGSLEAGKLSMTAWGRYGYLYDNYAAFRDKMRFTLSPFFDLSRYTEAYVLNQIGGPMRGANGERIGIPFNASPKKLRKMLGEAEFRKVRNEFRSAMAGRFDVDTLEQTERWFEEVGILGFNPTNWMTSSFYHMTRQGVSPQEAVEQVERMYHYGTKGRSAAEMSVNFVFFPFSFAKKTLTHAAEFLGDDMMRSVLLHDAVAAWQMLEDEMGVELDQIIENHLPVLEKLKQLNMFAFGVSPGRLGGINAPVVDFMVGNPMSSQEEKRGLLFNLFQPQAVFVKDEKGKNELTTLMRRMIPVINDVHHLLEDGRATAGGLMSPSRQTARADIADGYAEWEQFKQGIDAALKESVATWQDMYNNPGMAPLYDMYLRKRNELETKFPGWAQSRLEAQQKNAELELERRIRTENVLFGNAMATPGDLAMFEFERQLGNLDGQRNGTMEVGLRQIMEQQGITATDDWPPDVITQLKGVAVEMAQRTPEFEMIWRKFYQRQFGPLSSEVI